MTGPGLYDCPADTAPCEPNWYCTCVDAGSPYLAPCPAAQADAPTTFCPPTGVYGMSRARCDEGELWSILQTGTGPLHGCFYADGGLVGSTNRNDHGGEVRWGTVQFSNCVDFDPCGDAGVCVPSAPGACVLLRHFDSVCAASETAQRNRVCSAADAGGWSLRACANGWVWVEERPDLGTHTECDYSALADDRLIGAQITSDAGVATFAGFWLLSQCQPAPRCP